MIVVGESRSGRVHGCVVSTRASQIWSHGWPWKDDHGGLERLVDEIDLDIIMQDKACREI